MLQRRHLLVCGALAALLTAGAGHEPGTAATINMAYDEIVKFGVSATPPPPGNFAQDYAAIVPASAAPGTVAQATPAPQQHHSLFGGFDPRGMAHAIANGGDVGSVITQGAVDTGHGARDAQVDNTMDQVLSASLKPFANTLAKFAAGTLERHYYYNGWERVDDVSDGTATIIKCSDHQRIILNTTAKTYHVEDTSAPDKSLQSAPHSTHASCDRGTTTQSPPGTGTLTISLVQTKLPTMQIDGMSSPGVRSTTTIAISNATGSCKNGSYSVSSTMYYTKVPRDHPYCPLPKAYVHPTTPVEMAEAQNSGGCKLKTAFNAKLKADPNANLLPFYELFEMGSPQTGSGQSINFVTERGNIRPLGDSDAALFDVPAGYREAQ